MENLQIYTDGSFHPQEKVGSWVFIALLENEIIQSGLEQNSSQHRMELKAVIESIIYAGKIKGLKKLNIFTDSQYVFDLQQRKEKILKNNYKTKTLKEIRNKDLLKIFFELKTLFELEILKVKSHEKEYLEQTNYNRLADKTARKLIRDYFKSK